MKHGITVTFFSNYLNHHQIPFSNAMYELLGDNYKFVATEKMEEERVNLGWTIEGDYKFCINSFESKENNDYALRLGYESDVVIIGSAEDIYVNRRIKEGKLTFRYSERFFKKGAVRLLDPRVFSSLYLRHIKYSQCTNLHMLCASAYTAGDVSILRSYKGRTYKWGYFPETLKYDIDQLLKKKENKKPRLLWVGRFIDWKHPETVIKLAQMLKQDCYEFELCLIGTGEMEKKLKELIDKLDVADRVKLLGSMKPQQVREYMESANVFIATSDYNEGWGAVINESMNSACAVVASHAIGSVPFLIKHGVNGVIYQRGNDNDMFTKVKLLLDNEMQQREMGLAAYTTIVEQWNAELAASRLIDLFQSILRNENIDFDEGPCSRAYPIKHTNYMVFGE